MLSPRKNERNLDCARSRRPFQAARTIMRSSYVRRDDEKKDDGRSMKMTYVGNDRGEIYIIYYICVCMYVCTGGSYFKFLGA